MKMGEAFRTLHPIEGPIISPFVCLSACLSVCLSVNSPITQNNKFTISLQYLKKEVTD